MPRRTSPALLLLGLISLPLISAPLRAQEMTLELDPANTKIQFTLGDILHTVHGAFTLKRGTIHFNPSTGSAAGLVVVDAASGDSGNKSRDRKMHKEILESQTFPEVTFAPTKVSGAVLPQGSSAVQVEGVFRLHGTDHPITLTLPLRVTGDKLSAKTHLVIPYVAWGLRNPSNFILRVSDKVEIDISASGHLVQPSAAQPAANRPN
jgi:polyisoprenoid-binding protein YceI